MISSIYRKAFSVIAKKPFRLWGISLLANLLNTVMFILFGGLLGLALAINVAISTAMTIIFLRGYRGETPKAVDLFACLKDFKTAKRVVGGMAWMSLWIFLWALIPFVGIVFAIIKAYSYRLTPYILVGEPEVSATEAIKVSEQRTKGYRGKMFGADILVYVIIYAVIFVLSLIGGILSRFSIGIGGLFMFIVFLVSIAVAIFLPLFCGLVQAAFYEEIMTNINKKTNADIDELKKYKELLDSGIITQEEFDAKKKQLLGL